MCRWLLRIVLLLIVLGLFLPGVALAAKTYHAERFDVSIVVQEDGALQITETVVFRFTGGPFTFVRRELPTDHLDALTDVQAEMDGTMLPTGQEAGQVEIGGRDPLRIVWHFAPTSDATHTFVLRYRALGVARQTRDADLLVWQALPDDYPYRIAASAVTVTYPPQAALRGEPQVQAGKAQVARDGNTVTFTARDLEEDDPLVVALSFAPGSLITEPPAWQARQQIQNRAGSWFIALAGTLLVLGGSALVGWTAWAARREEGRLAPLDDVARPVEPPDNLPPALAGAIAGGAAPQTSHALATILDLARRGVLRIQELAEKKWYRAHEFVIERAGEADVTLRPHEQALLALLFETRHGAVDVLRLSELSTRLAARWQTFARPVKQELAEAGFIDAARQQRKRNLNILGLALLLLSTLGGVALMLILVPLFGGWPIVLPFAGFLLAMLAIVLAASFSPLSRAGEEAARRWKGFASYLKDVTRGRAQPLHADYFEAYLPCAAAFGLAPAWVKHFQKQGGVIPPVWFHALSTAGAESMGAFIVLISAASASTSSAGGAGGAGAGAAGGGSSAAG